MITTELIFKERKKREREERRKAERWEREIEGRREGSKYREKEQRSKPIYLLC